MKKKQIRLLTLSNRNLKINPSNRKVCQLFSLISDFHLRVDVNTHHDVEKICGLDDFDRDVN